MPSAAEVVAPDEQAVEPATPGRRRARLVAVVVALVGLAIDVVTKVLAVDRLDPANPPVLLGGLLTLRLVRNPGAAFSMGTSATVLLSLLAITALVVCVGWLLPRVRTRGEGILLGLAMAGVAGNLVDRLFRPPGVLRGHVVDFFSVPHFAIFNMADVFLTTAAALVVLRTVLDAVAERGRKD